MTDMADKLSNLQTGLTFDDVLILPEASAMEPTEALLQTRVSKNVSIAIPIVSSPMDRVTETAMCMVLGELGGLGVIHRNMNAEQEIAMAKQVKDKGFKVGAAVGPFDLSRALALDKVGVDVLVIDCAHGHNLKVVEGARRIKESVKADVVVGNIATAWAAEDLCKFADGLRVGIGPGATCTTRIITGCGVPQLTAITEVARIARAANVPIIADGGLRYSGDMVKALAAGASSVMNGSILAGTDASPGEIVTFGDKQYKSYRGMGSLGAITGTDRYGDGKSEKIVPEGIEGVIIFRGSTAAVVHQLIGGIRAGMGYVGARTLDELYQKARFIRVTPIGIRENHPHSMIQTKDQPNYPAE